MITLHHLEDSRSHRVVWLLEELGCDYEIVQYERRGSGLAPRELREVHPLGKSPVITHEGRTIAESGAIFEYLLDAFDEGILRPEYGTDAHLRYRYWLHFAEGTAMPPLLLKLVMKRLENVGPPVIRQIVRAVSKKAQSSYVDREIDLRAGFVESELAESDWLVDGAFGAADVMMSFPIQGMLARGEAAERYPRMKAFVERIEARDAYRRAVARGGELAITG